MFFLFFSFVVLNLKHVHIFKAVNTPRRIVDICYVNMYLIKNKLDGAFGIGRSRSRQLPRVSAKGK